MAIVVLSSFIIVYHTRFVGQAGGMRVEPLGLAVHVVPEDHRIRRQIHIKADDVGQVGHAAEIARTLMRAADNAAKLGGRRPRWNA
jgi:hypothetical protein